MKRHTNKKKKKETIIGLSAKSNYVKYFNAVDKNDHGRSFYLTIIQTIHCYLRAFCWVLKCVVNTLFVLVCYLAKSSIGKSEWNNYLNKNNGRHYFQIDPAISLINFAIALK